MNTQATQAAQSTIDIERAVHFAAIDLPTGIHMNYAEFGDSKGETVVFLHGLSDSWFSFSPVLEHLPPTYHVYMPDQRGHGNSTQPETGYAVADFADDAIVFMDALNLRRVTLVGHSLGSFVAQRVAARVPERVARLVLIGSATKVYTKDVAELGALFSALEDPVPEAVARDFQLSTLFNAVSPEFLNRVVSESMKLRAHVWRGVARDLLMSDETTKLEQLQVPTLVLWGEQDLIWSRAEQEALVGRIPVAELRTYPMTGHALHWEQPEQFARDLEAFINQNRS
jgi:non-heme chloroperoxidase